MITQSSLHMAPMLIILPHTCTLYTGKQVLFKWTSGEGNCVTFGRLICVWGSLPLSIMTFGKRLWHICLNLEKSGLTAFSSSLFSSSAAWVSISNSGFSMITPFSTVTTIISCLSCSCLCHSQEKGAGGCKSHQCISMASDIIHGCHGFWSSLSLYYIPLVSVDLVAAEIRRDKYQ